MMHRRPIVRHPFFAPLITVWFAALFGLTMAVLPWAVLDSALAGAGLGGVLPQTLAGKAILGLAAAMVGALAGHALARRIARRTGGDPRPIYAEAEAEVDAPMEEPQRRRPLHVREELEGGFGDESQVLPARPRVFATHPEAQDGFMILTPQPIHPPPPEPDLAALLEQFDTAFAAFRDGEGQRAAGGGAPAGADPVQTFVARQTGAPASVPASASSPIGRLVPDHQAELRAALDKLARSQGKI